MFGASRADFSAKLSRKEGIASNGETFRPFYFLLLLQSSLMSTAVKKMD